MLLSSWEILRISAWKFPSSRCKAVGFFNSMIAQLDPIGLGFKGEFQGQDIR